ncbi:MAG: Crp/Fnr family transcriptional regulator [Bryobacterales bacterium]|nr:Crp/Fnr family transcriptional regulator [Bryobacterales bacterium]
MTGQVLLDTLRIHPFTEGFTQEQLERLAGLAGQVRFQKNAIIFHEGDESSFFYLLLSGSVVLEVTAPGRSLRIQTLGKGEELGWSSLLAPTPGKQFQARALEPVEALVFDGARLRRACDEECSFGYAMMRSLLKVVASRLQATRIQLLDVYSPVKSPAGA